MDKKIGQMYMIIVILMVLQIVVTALVVWEVSLKPPITVITVPQ